MLERLAGAGFVLVLTVFMLIRRENLRNRLIRLLGYGRLTITTRAMEEAGQRISRYLVMQALLNSSFGIAVGLGLFLFGLPYAFLWGFLAALLRFVPYVGSWAAALLPTVLALAVFNGWLWPLAVFGFIVALEIVIATILEPLLYGESAGISEVGMLVSVAFWTWLWGPVGLLLAMPLTVCVVVISKYVPANAVCRRLAERWVGHRAAYSLLSTFARGRSGRGKGDRRSIHRRKLRRPGLRRPNGAGARLCQTRLVAGQFNRGPGTVRGADDARDPGRGEIR